MNSKIFKRSSISVIIRAWNEAELLERLLKKLSEQNYPKELVEIIVVNNGSTDNTKEVIQKYGALEVYREQKDFSYPKSSNAGIRASKNELLIFISAHALPIDTHWFESASRHFQSETKIKLAGVYGENAAGPGSSIWEKIIRVADLWKYKRGTTLIVNKLRPGICNATNCAIPRELLVEHQFDETFGAGGEDYEWARWAIENNYYFIKDCRFTVYHAHGLSLLRLFAQQKYWVSLSKPQQFSTSKLAYRSDLAKRTGRL